MLKSFKLLCLFFFLYALSVFGAENALGWQRPVIVPLPDSTAGVESPVISLNGQWRISLEPPDEFWRNEIDVSGWPVIEVPGEALMQGFNIKKDREFVYKKKVDIPPELDGKKLILRFDGVYSYARVWVNGRLVRDHTGGFTAWDCDVTPYVRAGRSAWITVGVADRSDEISWGSEYAKHNIGGILRDVSLIVLPVDYVSRLHVETGFDSLYLNATLGVSLSMVFGTGSEVQIGLKLKDINDNPVTINPGFINLKPGSEVCAVKIPVTEPLKWDAEHPNLYSLQVTAERNGSILQTLSCKIGFRQVERAGSRLLVNGKEIKLRGVNRHDVHPTRGRSTTAELDETDVRLFREANVNFIRTSHYPPSRAFLDACDRYGMYVEEETAICFVGTHGNLLTSDRADFTSNYLNQFAEMIERDRSHPSVIIWSLGNESTWGTNFGKERDYVRSEDPSRPVIFSYPNTVPDGVEAYEILSVHYVDCGANMGGQSITYPVLHDEFAHVACYNSAELRRDPGVRDFWGESIKLFGEDIFTTDGALGGAIWGGIDEVFQVPVTDQELTESTKKNGFSRYGYGPWGIIDGWRRKKPEFWHTKKGFSPVRLESKSYSNPGDGNPIVIPVENRFDHTDFSELRILWRVNGDSGRVGNVAIKPHDTGLLTIPPRRWRDGQVLNLRFFRRDSILVDEFDLRVGDKQVRFPPAQGPPPSVAETGSLIEVAGAGFLVEFSKASGLIARASYQGTLLIESGPFLNIAGTDPGEEILWRNHPPKNEAKIAWDTWELDSLKSMVDSVEAVVSIAGHYREIAVSFEVRIDGAGLITTRYAIENPPEPSWERGFSEVGIAYLLPAGIDRLSWEREGLWSCYPEDHIGRNEGLAHRLRSRGDETYGLKPEWSWSEDMKDFFLSGRDDQGRGATNDFRSARTNVFQACAILSGTGLRVRAESGGTLAVRAEVEGPENGGRVVFIMNNLWNYPNLLWGNYMKERIFIARGYGNLVKMRLTDDGGYN